MDNIRPPQKGKIFFDGLCKVCSMEIEHYQRLDQGRAFDFIDITHPAFRAQEFGIDPFEVHKVMHVQEPTGEMKKGVDAFISIWKNIPRYHWVAQLAERSLVRSVLNLGYNGFTRIRPFLPRKNRSECASSPFCEFRPQTESSVGK